MTAARQLVLVTGASSGIGRATIGLLSRDFDVVGMVRSEEDAKSILDRHDGRVRPIVADLLDDDSLLRLAETLRELLGLRPLAGFVNCAGIAISGPLELLPIELMREQFEVNVVGPLRLSQLLLPLLGTQRRGVRPGRIVYVSSLSGRLADPFLGPYAASKHAVEAIAASLRREVSRWGVRVIVVAPGAVKTPIWQKAARSDMSAYVGTGYGGDLLRFRDLMFDEASRGCEADDVARVVLHSLTKRWPRRRYSVMARPHALYRLLCYTPTIVYDWICRWTLRDSVRRRPLSTDCGSGHGPDPRSTTETTTGNGSGVTS